MVIVNFILHHLCALNIDGGHQEYNIFEKQVAL